MSRFFNYIKLQWLLGNLTDANMEQMVVMNRITDKEKIEIMEGK